MNPAELFSHESNPVRLAPAAVLFRSGEPADGMLVVLEGTLEVLVGDTVVERATRGAILGEMALIDQSPRSATVVACDDTTLVKLDLARFQRLVQQHPFFATHVMKVLADRIRLKDRSLNQEKPA